MQLDGCAIPKLGANHSRAIMGLGRMVEGGHFYRNHLCIGLPNVERVLILSLVVREARELRGGPE
jgi:hypothetical protein